MIIMIRTISNDEIKQHKFAIIGIILIIITATPMTKEALALQPILW